MIILWIRKKKTDEPNRLKKRENQSFRTHDDIMKQFRLAHPDVNIVSAQDILASDSNLLVPVPQVKLTENIQN